MLIRQPCEIIRSSDPVGRHFSENELGVYNPARIQRADKGISLGGHWYGVKSNRHYFEWYRDTRFGLRDLEECIRSIDRDKERNVPPSLWRSRRHRVLVSAYEYVRVKAEREKAA